MTIRHSDLTIKTDAHAYLVGGGQDVTTSPVTPVLALVRGIMRERTCGQVPVVLHVVNHAFNEWGDNYQIEVEYDRKGWRAIYGARVAPNGRVESMQCYMD